MKSKKQFKKVVRIYYEGDTEKNYIKSMISDKYQGVTCELFPKIKNRIEDLLEYAHQELSDPETNMLQGLILVLDMDVLYKDNKISAYREKKRVMLEAGNDKLLFVENRPCIEYWFLLHYVFCDRLYKSCEEVLVELKKPGRLPDYDKKDRYTKRIYGKLKDNINNAVKHSKSGWTKKRGKDDQYSSTNMHELLEMLDGVIQSEP